METIQKTGLYKFNRVTFSQPHRIQTRFRLGLFWHKSGLNGLDQFRQSPTRNSSIILLILSGPSLRQRQRQWQRPLSRYHYKFAVLTVLFFQVDKNLYTCFETKGRGKSSTLVFFGVEQQATPHCTLGIFHTAPLVAVPVEVHTNLRKVGPIPT